MERKHIIGLVIGTCAGILFFIVRKFFGSLLLSFCVSLLLIVAGIFAILWWDQHPARAAKAAVQESPSAPPDPEQDEALRQAHACLDRIFNLIYEVQLASVNREALECAELCRQILQAADEKPKIRGNLSNFFHHYLPMFEQMMANYLKCASASVLPDSLVQEITDFLDVMESAMKKLKENLYSSDMLHLSVDMEVLQNLYQTDGLLDGELAVQPKEG